MQGRLVPPEGGRFQSFPVAGWRRELRLAAKAGIDGIEWIYDEFGVGANPLETGAGVAEMRQLAERQGVAVESLCADWFMDRPLLGSEPGERLGRLRWVLERARAAGILRIVLPFVDASSLRGDDHVDAVVQVLSAVLPELDVELHLETDLPPEGFADLLGRLGHPLVKANYDTGNSASLGYDPGEEFAAYGARIGSVHVKDRLRDGGTVPLGEGAADLERVFSLLHRQKWNRPLVLQVARGEDGGEPETVRAAVEHVVRLWAQTETRAWS